MIKHLVEEKGNYLTLIRNRKMGIPTGFPTLDKMLFGFNPAYYILAARPSVGKTALAMNMAVHSASCGKKVVFFSIEMPEISFVERLVSMLAGVSVSSIRDNTVPSDFQADLDDIDSRIEALNMYVDYASRHTPLSIAAQLDYLEQQKGFVPDIAFVDYIQYMHPTSGAGMTPPVALAEISRSIVQIIKDRQLPIVMLAQLNRGADEYTSTGDRKMWVAKRPRLSDIKGSGNIEEDADVVLLLHRDDYHKEREDASYDADSTPVGNASIIVAKNRQGPCGSFNCTWLPDIFKFTEGVNTDDCPF